MCEYCDCNSIIKNLYEGDIDVLEIDIDENELSYFAIGKDIEFSIPINYCPMCGRSLEGDKTITYETKSLYGRILDEVNEGVG